MADIQQRTMGAGLPPGNGTTYNPRIGVTCPPGTPLCPSAGEDGVVIPADASDSDLVGVVAVAAITCVAGEAGLAQYSGPLDLTTAQWDAITGQTGGLTRNANYYLSAASAGKLTTTPPSAGGTTAVPVGVGLSPTTLMIQISLGIAN